MTTPDAVRHHASRFGAYLRERKADVLDTLTNLVNADDAIPSADRLTRAQMIDHFGQLLDQLGEVLGHYEMGDVAALSARIAHGHGHQRQQLGFSITETLGELERLRRLLAVDMLHEYAQSCDPALTVAELKPLNAILHAFFRHMVVHSVARFESEKQAEADDLVARLRQANDELGAVNADLRRRESQILKLSRTDALTGLPNRRALTLRLREETNRRQRYDSPLSVVMMDIDHFKRINDRHGHAAGDRVLECIGSLLAGECRHPDTAARAGGEEFVILLPHTGVDDAVSMAERLRSQLARHVQARTGFKITASFGVAQFEPGEKPAAMLRRADAAMYRVKHAGRDGVQVQQRPPALAPG